MRFCLSMITLLVITLLPLSACQRQHHAAQPTVAPLSQMALIGKKLFYARSLSISGQQSCASCHDPAHGYSPADDRDTELGGADGHQQGFRAVPKLSYALMTPAFSLGAEEAEGHAGSVLARQDRHGPKRSTDLVPRGGMFWDGRVDSLQGQALGPLLNPLEMGNTSVAMLVGRLKALAVDRDLLPLVGPAVQHDDRLLLAEALFAIGRYEFEDHSFARFDSKYDRYLHHQVQLSPAELRGLADFEDPKIGNCAACHPSRPQAQGQPPLFTDYEYEALGVPRNPRLQVNHDAHFYDLGLGGPQRQDSYAHQPGNCGLFKTPTLRNVALRHTYFHNGIYHNLHEVLRFYAERDAHPERIYPRDAEGHLAIFNDLPRRYQGNIDRIDAPLNRQRGDAPALSAAQQDDIIAFLGTLSDGYPAPR